MTTDKNIPRMKKNLGIFSTMAIIIGQMIGSGIYMTPQGLAQITTPHIAIVSIVITGIGTIFLSLSFIKLSSRKAVSGSAIVYTQEAFGSLPAFWVGWSYWFGCWIANCALIIAGIDYAAFIIPALKTNTLLKSAICILIIWLYTIINFKGVKQAGIVNLIITCAKLLPILIFLVIAIIHFDSSYLSTTSSSNVTGIDTLPTAIAYTLWCYLGFEGATVTGDEVKNGKTITLATIISTGCVIILYLVLILLSAGNISQAELASSTAPFADIINHATGAYWAGAFIAFGGSLSAIGCAGAWILSTARISYSLSRLSLLPASLGKLDPKSGTPKNSLLVNGLLMTAIIILCYFTREGSIYNILVMLTVTSFLVFYAFGAASEIALSIKGIRPLNVWQFIKCSIISLIAFVYSVYTIIGSGANYVFYQFLFMIIILPIYIYIKQKGKNDETIGRH